MNNQHRGYVGPAEAFDLIAAMQFNLLTGHGMRETHSVLDIGCGCLRFGRLAIVYLLPGRYYGIEPNRQGVLDGINAECSAGLIELKRPNIIYAKDFKLSAFKRRFGYLIAQSIFSHTTKEQMRTCLVEAEKCMHATSMFFATFVEGDKDYEGDTWVYPGCSRFRKTTVVQLAEGAGLAATEVEGYTHPFGQKWMLFKKA